MGRVWAATGPAARPLAVKCLRSGGQDRSTLDRELALLARLDHPNVAAILDHGVLTDADEAPVELIGQPWIAVERLDADLVARPPGTWSELRAVLTRVAEGLAHAHARGVLHLDLKPANVMWAGATPRIVDFGVAELAGSGGSGRVRGSPGFMSPEQLAGQPPTVANDLFGLGALAWALLSGNGPFESPSIAAIRAAAAAGEPHPLPEWVPPELAGLLAALVAPDPSARPAFAADVVAALEAMRWPEGELPARMAGTSPTLVALTFDAYGEAPVEDAPRVDVQPLRVPPAPFPADWRGEEPTLTPRHGTEAAMVGLRTLPIVGRDAERERLWALLREVATTGEPRTIRVDGPSGSGVDRLVSWLCERAIETGAAHVVEGPAPLETVLGRDRPTVWVDGPSTALRLAGTQGRAPVLAVSRRGGSDDLETLTLGPLPLSALRLLVRNVTMVDDAIVGRVISAAGGLPGFAIDLLQHWLRTGALRSEAGRYALTTPTPPLPPTWAALRCEAVDRFVGERVGMRAALELLAAWPVGRADPTDLDAALVWLVERGLPPPPADWRREASAAGLLTQTPGLVRLAGPDIVASLLDHPSGVERRPQLLLAVASTAARAGVRGSAWRVLGNLERAAAEMPVGPELLDLLTRLGVDDADPRMVACRLGEAEVAFTVGDADQMTTALARIPGDGAGGLRARLFAVRADLANLQGRVDDARAFADAALAHDPEDWAARTAWARVQTVAPRDLGAVDRILGWVDEGGKRAGVLVRLASRAAAVLGDRVRSHALLDRSDAMEPGNPHAQVMRGMLAASAGDAVAALRELGEAARRHRDGGNVFGVLVTLRWRVDVLLDAGRDDEAWTLLDEADRIEAIFGSVQSPLAMIRGERPGGVWPGGRSELERELQELEETIGMHDHSPRSTVRWAQAVGDPDLLAWAVDQAIQIDTRLGHPRLARWVALREALSEPRTGSRE